MSFSGIMINEKGKQLALWGVGLQFGFAVGVVGTVIGLILAFGELSQNGQAQPEALASDISLALYTTVGGMLLSLVGVVLLLMSLFGAKYRAPWFKTAMWIFAILWLFNVPIGTIVGIVVMLYLSKYNHEFTEPSPAPCASATVEWPSGNA